ISSNTLWRYLDDGSDQGTAWRLRFFNDSEWAAGYARLGYGGDGENTVVSFGPDPNKKFITTWFRRAFNVPNPSAFRNLRLSISRDDGAVMYLNGFEVYRSNMRSGAVSYNSLALTAVERPQELAFLDANLSPASLVAGTNVLAVEIHQASINSSDIGFDLSLI